VRNGIVGTDAFRSVDVEGSHFVVVRDFQKVGRVGRVPSSNHENEIEAILGGIFNEFLDGVLSFLGSGGKVGNSNSKIRKRTV
jgi:hypothetical protein